MRGEGREERGGEGGEGRGEEGRGRGLSHNLLFSSVDSLVAFSSACEDRVRSW